MKTTANYGFKMPEGTYVINIDDLNYNVGVIDTKLKEVEKKAGSVIVPVTSINSKTGAVVLNAADIKTSSGATVESHLAESVTKTTKDLTYYINPSTGNDSNNGLTTATAFKTFAKATSMIPQVVNNTVIINCAAGGLMLVQTL